MAPLPSSVNGMVANTASRKIQAFADALGTYATISPARRALIAGVKQAWCYLKRFGRSIQSSISRTKNPEASVVAGDMRPSHHG